MAHSPVLGSSWFHALTIGACLFSACSDDDGAGDDANASSSTTGSTSTSATGTTIDSQTSGVTSSTTATTTSAADTGSESEASTADAASSAATTEESSEASVGSSGEASSGGGESGESGASETGAPTAAFVVTSPAFEGREGCGPGDRGVAAEPDGDPDLCDELPQEHVGDNIGGDDVSPALQWENPPEGTSSFAVALHDLSYWREGDPFTHWVVWNIPSDLSGVPEMLPSGSMLDELGPEARQVSYQAGNGYAGPGAAGNVYEFIVYALGDELFAPSSVEGMPARVTDLVHGELDELSSILGTARIRVRSAPPAP